MAANTDINGELLFFTTIKDKINTIFDVGCRQDSEYINFEGTVHYFDPVSEFVDNLKLQPNKNKCAYFNSFGLGEETKDIYYYKTYQSFYDRIISCGVSDIESKTLLKMKRADEYIKENSIQDIDFLKIDTEGYEFNVLKGFGDYLRNVKIIQFEYGGTYLDCNTKLIEVIEYLQKYGFDDFSYIVHNGLQKLADFNDHYQYSNIVCVNKVYKIEL